MLKESGCIYRSAGIFYIEGAIYGAELKLKLDLLSSFQLVRRRKSAQEENIIPSLI